MLSLCALHETCSFFLRFSSCTVSTRGTRIESTRGRCENAIVRSRTRIIQRDDPTPWVRDYDVALNVKRFSIVGNGNALGQAPQELRSLNDRRSPRDETGKSGYLAENRGVRGRDAIENSFRRGKRKEERETKREES